jgi:zinc/manganese transport system substrate-binding protein
VRRLAVSSFLATTAGLGLLLTGCGPTAGGTASPSPSPSAGGVIEVVTSTNVYGDIVKAVGGEKVNVSAIISKSSQDPHSYEATTQDRLAISKAGLVVENGGGYDDFLHKIAEDSGIEHENILSAVEVSGLAPEEEAHSESPAATEEADEHGHEAGFNEHVWYNLDAMSKLADEVSAKLGTLDPASAQTFTANAETFKSGLAGLEDKLAAVKADAEHSPVAVTEPVPVYLLEAAGLENKTPAEYSAAIEEGNDVPPAVLNEATELVASGGVKLLAYNNQTEGPQTQALKKAAEAAGVPVVDFSETLPEGSDYLQWMTSNVENISQALGK